jgi:ABC-type nitrate/sulfonate/bicarbonate transport system substrate-binding protein
MKNWKLAVAALAMPLAFSTAPAKAADAPIKMQIYQGGPQILPLIAKERGFFTKNGITVELVTIQTGPQATNALLSGSVDIAILSPLNTASLLTKGEKLTAISGLQKVFVSLVGRKGASTTWPDSLLQLKGKRIATLALGAAGQLICETALQAAGLKPTDYAFAATGTELGSGTALEQGAVDAACINPQTRIPLAEQGFPVLFDFLTPSQPAASYPESFRPNLNLSFVQLWARPDWATSNAAGVAALMKSLAQADHWMKDPANFNDVLKTVRGSIYDIPSFDDKRFGSYVKDMINAHRLQFPVTDTDTWTKVVKTSMSLDLPPRATWVAPNAPASDDDLAKLTK